MSTNNPTSGEINSEVPKVGEVTSEMRRPNYKLLRSKSLSKISKRFPNNWDKILKGLIEEYKYFDLSEINGGAKYNLLVTSPDGVNKFYKIEVRFYPNMSASKGGCRAGVFVIKNKQVIVAFAGLHEHLDKFSKSDSDKTKMLEILKSEYKDLFDLLYEG